jgi:hypothetical protein
MLLVLTVRVCQERSRISTQKFVIGDDSDIMLKMGGNNSEDIPVPSSVTISRAIDHHWNCGSVRGRLRFPGQSDDERTTFVAVAI